MLSKLLNLLNAEPSCTGVAGVLGRTLEGEASGCKLMVVGNTGFLHSACLKPPPLDASWLYTLRFPQANGLPTA